MVLKTAKLLQTQTQTNYTPDAYLEFKTSEVHSFFGHARFPFKKNKNFRFTNFQ